MLTSNIKYLTRHHYLKLQDVTFRVSDDSALNFFMKITARLLTPMVAREMLKLCTYFFKDITKHFRNIRLNKSTPVTDQASSMVTVTIRPTPNHLHEYFQRVQNPIFSSDIHWWVESPWLQRKRFHFQQCGFYQEKLKVFVFVFTELSFLVNW